LLSLYCNKKGDKRKMSYPINDIILDNIADDVCELYEDKGVWGVVDAIAEEFGNEKVPYSKDDDDMIDALIELRFEALPEA
jgi:hypothetical protein